VDKSTVIGMTAAWLFIVLGVTDNFADMAAFGAFFNVPSIMIVVGGTIAVVMVAFTMEQIKELPAIFKKAFFAENYDPAPVISRLVSFAEKARREGLLALEDDLERLEDDFLKGGIQMVIDGTDPEIIKAILEIEIAHIDERHRTNMGIMDTAGTLAPAFGMIGTLIGLINMLKALDDPDALGPGMAVALITTLYGSIIANVVFIPISNKLKMRNDEELFYKQMMLDGLLSIQAGDNPRVVGEKLKAYMRSDDSDTQKDDDEDDDD
jgi:chemotaxis protein MotA